LVVASGSFFRQDEHSLFNHKNISYVGGRTRKLEYHHDAASYRLTIKKPAVNMAEDWSIVLYA
jgi:hypothetical protein